MTDDRCRVCDRDFAPRLVALLEQRIPSKAQQDLWLHAEQPALRHRRPVDLIYEHRTEAVYTALAALDAVPRLIAQEDGE